MELELTEETFRALARSSPWRWSTLRFDWRTSPGAQRVGLDDAERLQAWIRRPGELRVEDGQGTVVGRGTARTVRSGWTPLTSGRGSARAGVSLPPAPGEPTYRSDGLVDERPWPDDDHDPFFRNYLWLAALDPAELGRVESHEGKTWAGAELSDLRASVHRDRLVWDAMVRPAEDYQARCGCCPLLDTCDRDMSSTCGCVHAEATLVRLDVQTGVCVQTRHIGGVNDGGGHEIRIHAVDEPLDDALFAV